MEKPSSIVQYTHRLFRFCSDYKPEGLPDVGDLYHQEYKLQDIYMPLKLYGDQEREKEVEAEDPVEPEGLLEEIDDLLLAIGRDQQNDLLEPVTKSDQVKGPGPAGLEARTKGNDLDQAKLDGLMTEIDMELAALEELPHVPDLDDALGMEHLLKELEWELMRLDSEVKVFDMAVSKLDGLNEWNAAEGDQHKQESAQAAGQARAERNLIIAGPGYGKTTMMKRIALAYAEEDRAFLKENDLKSGLFPVLLLCRTMVAGGGGGEGDSFETDMVQMLGNSYFRRIADDEDCRQEWLAYVAEKAEAGKLLLMVDGFDEIYSTSAQLAFGQALERFVAAYPKTHLIVTSRPETNGDQNEPGNGYLEPLSGIGGLEKKTIRPMVKEEVSFFVRRWFQAIYPLDRSKDQEAEAIIDQIHSKTYSYLQATNIVQVPLHLTNILLLSRATGKLPASKKDLYKEYIGLAVKWKSKDSHNPQNMLMILSFAALAMMKVGMTRIGHGDLSGIVEDAKAYFEGYIDEDKSADEWIWLMESRSRLIQLVNMDRNEGIYQFSHNQFKEYLAAYALVEGYDHDENADYSATNRVLAMLGNNTWSEVVSFGVHMLGAEPITGELVGRIREKREQQVSDYHEKNLLFSIVCNFGFIVPRARREILTLIFESGITSPQVRDMEAFLLDERSAYFSRFIEEAFAASLERGDVNFGTAMGTIEIYRCFQEDKDPVAEAEKRFVEGRSEAEVLCGSYMLNMMAWGINEEIEKVPGRKGRRNFIFDMNPDQIGLGEAFAEAFSRKLMASEGKRWRVYTSHLIDLMHAGMVETPSSIFTLDLFSRAIEEAEEENGIGLRLLSAFPLNEQSLTYASLVDCSRARTLFFDAYREGLERKRHKERVFYFIACLLTGVWETAEDKIKAYRLFKKAVKEDDPSHAAKRLMKGLEEDMGLMRLDHRFFELVTSKNAFMEKIPEAQVDHVDGGLYESDTMIDAYDEVLGQFLQVFDPDVFDSAVNNFLAAMVRQEVIDTVSVKGREYTVPELLEEGVRNKDVHALVNMALYVSSVYEGGDITRGEPYIQAIDPGDQEQILRIKQAWLAIVDMEELESHVVIYWLLKHKLIKSSPLGSLQTMEAYLVRHNIMF